MGLSIRPLTCGRRISKPTRTTNERRWATANWAWLWYHIRNYQLSQKLKLIGRGKFNHLTITLTIASIGVGERICSFSFSLQHPHNTQNGFKRGWWKKKKKKEKSLCVLVRGNYVISLVRLSAKLKDAA